MAGVKAKPKPKAPARIASIDAITTWTRALALLGCLGAVACAGATSRGGPSTPQRVAGIWHTVSAGETLFALARRYRSDLTDLEELNGRDRRDALEVGARIFVPRSSGTSPPHGGHRARPIEAAERDRLAWPVPGGRLSSGFGPRQGRPHEGIDIAAPEGTPILAAQDGRVLYAGAGIRGYGNFIMIRHAGDLVTIYAHNRRNHVEEGQMVRQGEVIGEVGRSGRATGYHLHFEVRRRETPLDPLRYLNAPR